MAKKTPAQKVSKFEDRVRFNWGYHDAASEATSGRRRMITETGEHNTTQVSKKYDAAYFGGYVAGLADSDMGLYRGDSENAWNNRNA